MLHLETLSPVALDLLKALSAHPSMESFALAGDTSLALRFGLDKLVADYRTKFPETDPLMLMRSMSYFDDAEADEDPRSLCDLTWEDIKSGIRKTVRTALEP